jgi:hypothetical protein
VLDRGVKQVSNHQIAPVQDRIEAQQEMRLCQLTRRCVGKGDGHQMDRLGNGIRDDLVEIRCWCLSFDSICIRVFSFLRVKSKLIVCYSATPCFPKR